MVGKGEANDGVDVECAALGFAAAGMAAVAGDSDVGTGLGPGKLGIVIGAVSGAVPDKRPVGIGFADFSSGVPEIMPAWSGSYLLIISAEGGDADRFWRRMSTGSRCAASRSAARRCLASVAETVFIRLF